MRILGNKPIYVDGLGTGVNGGRYKVEGASRWFPLYDERPHAAPANRDWFPRVPQKARIWMDDIENFEPSERVKQLVKDSRPISATFYLDDAI